MRNKKYKGSLPWFANDEEIADAILGPGRHAEWKAMAQLLERKGLPKIDPYIGGRYMPAVAAFFDSQYGLTRNHPMAPDGTEDLSVWGRLGRGRLKTKS